MLCLLKRLHKVIGEQVFVLLRESSDVIHYITCVVIDLELRSLYLAWLFVVGMRRLLDVEFVHLAQ